MLCYIILGDDTLWSCDGLCCAMTEHGLQLPDFYLFLETTYTYVMKMCIDISVKLQSDYFQERRSRMASGWIQSWPQCMFMYISHYICYRSNSAMVDSEYK